MNHTRGLVSLTALVVLFVFGIIVGFRLATAPVPELHLRNDDAEPTCKNITLKPGSKLSREQVTVDVYNAGSISGLASQTQRRLTRFGYQRGVIGNADDLDVSARNVTLIADRPGGAMANLLRSQFRGKVRVVKGETSTSTSIGVVVGDRFVGLNRKSRSSVPVSKSLDICVPIESTPGTD